MGEDGGDGQWEGKDFQQGLVRVMVSPPTGGGEVLLPLLLPSYKGTAAPSPEQEATCQRCSLTWVECQEAEGAAEEGLIP